MDALTYRPCVGIMLLNAEGLVFVGRRKARRGPDIHPLDHEWQMPQGGIDEGETPFKAAMRELREETNVRSAELLGEAPSWLSYDLPTEIGKKTWRGRFRGQTQKWFALRFTGRIPRSTSTRPTTAATRRSSTPGAGSACSVCLS